MKKRMPPETYTLMHELLASPTAPMPRTKITQQLGRMWSGLNNIERGARPVPDDWRLCSDAVNLMETLVRASPITVRYRQGDKLIEDVYPITDGSGLLTDAVAALAIAGARSLENGGLIRLDGPGILAVRSVLEDYSAALEALPARVIIRCHRATEKRIREIFAGRRKAHDVEVVSL